MSAEGPPLVLASASPRRSDILSALGLEHTIDPARIPEEEREGEDPGSFVERLAREKAVVVAARHPAALVLAGDTVVVCGGRVLGKPPDAAAATRMLLDLAGREHDVLTGLALVLPRPSPSSADRDAVISRVDRTRVRFRPFDEATARAYVATGEPLDKAGAYGIQGRGAALVTGIRGDYHTVVGLPVPGLVVLLDRAGFPYGFPGPDERRPSHDSRTDAS